MDKKKLIDEGEILYNSKNVTFKERKALTSSVENAIKGNWKDFFNVTKVIRNRLDKPTLNQSEIMKILKERYSEMLLKTDFDYVADNLEAYFKLDKEGNSQFMIEFDIDPSTQSNKHILDALVPIVIQADKRLKISG